MIIYKVKEVLNKEGVTPYRLYTDKVLTNPTWENFKKGGDLSLKVLDKLCNYLNCDLDDLVEYVEDYSFEANSYLIQKAIEEKNFGEGFETLCEKIGCYELINLSKLYDDCFDAMKQEEITGLMYDVINVKKIIIDFDIAVKNAKNNPEISKRFQHLENLKDLHEELVSGIVYPILSYGSLSKLCNLCDSYCFGELLDSYLDKWREEHTEYNEDDEVTGIDYTDCYNIDNDMIIPRLDDGEFKELVDVINNAFYYEIEWVFDAYVDDFISKAKENE